MRFRLRLVKESLRVFVAGDAFGDYHRLGASESFRGSNGW